MDFFENQEAARKRTRLLVFYFICALVGIVAAIHTAFSLAVDHPLDDWRALAITAGGVLLFVAIGSLIKIAQLSQGGSAVAKMLGGELASQASSDPPVKRLLNVVEEMAIASGVPVPQVYILEDDSINAFAAGHGTADAAIGVTRGCLEKLTRDELQGVVGHEFSHILNGDMRLNIRLMGLLNGILMLAIVGGFLVRLGFETSSRRRSGNDKNGGSIIAVFMLGGVVLYIVGWIGVFFGNLIKAAVSRQREFLADASAVQFTRHPSGIANALRKIGASSSRISHPRAAEASHMFFGNGLSEPWFGLFATHPPIAERVRRIQSGEAAPPSLPVVATETHVACNPSPGIPDLAAGTSLLSSLPESPREALADIPGAKAAVLSILLSRDGAIRSAQISSLPNSDLAMRTQNAFFGNNHLDAAQKIAIADLAVPVLRSMSLADYITFKKMVTRFVEADGKIDLFEFTIKRLLLRHLDRAFSPTKRSGTLQHSIVPLLPDLGIILSAIANAEDDAPAAFADGLASLGKDAGAFPLSRIDEISLLEFDASLDRLSQATPAVKKSIFETCRAAVSGKTTPNPVRYSLFRAIADSLDCPVPPLSAP